MTPDQFLQRQFELSVQAGTNQRYHQSKSHLWSRCDRATKIAVGVLAVAGMCLSILTTSSTSEVWQGVSIAIACLAAIAAIALNVLPLGEWASDHRSLFQRWSDLREEIDALEFEVRAKVTLPAINRLDQLHRKVHRICSSEPGVDDALLRSCYESEYQSRQPGTPSSPQAHAAAC